MNNRVVRPFEVRMDDAEGRFCIRMFNKNILGTRLVARIGKKEAKLINVERMSGIDEDGPHEAWYLTYLSPKDESKTFRCSMKVFSGHTVFETIYDFKVKGKKKKHLYGNPYIAFPCFEGEKWDDGCSCLSFKRQAPFNYPEQWTGRIVDSLRDGKNIPLMVTNERYETVVLSPMNHMLFNTVSISHKPDSIRCGIPRAVKAIEADTRVQTLMVYGKGVNATLDRWGRLLRRHYGVRAAQKDEDVLLKYISYWTNAGSAYWYNAYKKTSYEETLRKLKVRHESIGLSFGSYQLDSWWYKKEGDEYTSGIEEWEPKQSTMSKNFNSMLPFKERYRNLPLFKEGRLSYVQSFLDRPIGCHFKQIAKDAVYVLEDKKKFVIEDFAVPRNAEVAERFFEKLFYHPGGPCPISFMTGSPT